MKLDKCYVIDLVLVLICFLCFNFSLTSDHNNSNNKDNNNSYLKLNKDELNYYK